MTTKEDFARLETKVDFMVEKLRGLDCPAHRGRITLLEVANSETKAKLAYSTKLIWVLITTVLGLAVGACFKIFA